ncbi:LysR family transcriptional regulator [Propionivibrio sp.]|jgi:DNA-binding transcriptional LysR family regulator|uniref:LysR family transcriptional regulator n=1 Tax=Propionivibrio sp. TaxID=2212460 RepID=UPI0039E4FC84
MDTRSLVYFIAVAEEQHIGRAASRLHITQPALTRRVHALEDEVGMPLFTRTPTGMKITPAGIALLQHARAVQAELAQAKLAVKQMGRKERQSFNVGVYGSAIFNVVPRILGEFSRKNPHVELRLHHVRKDQQIELLRQGKVQIAFDRFLPQEPDFAYELVHREHLCVALHEDHPLAAREIINIGDLDGELCIDANFDSEIASKLAQFFGSSPQVNHHADDVLSCLALVSCGLGISFAPVSIRSLGIPNVVYRPCLEASEIPFNLLCMYRKGDCSALIQDMLETISEFRSAQGDAAP